jgi:hypothetical protein
MYSGYEVTWNWYLFDDKCRANLDGRTPTRTPDADDSAHL